MLSRRSFLGACALGATSIIAGCAGGGARVGAADGAGQLETTLFAFDTVVSIKATCSQEALDAAATRCAYFESIFSRTIPESDIGRVNAAGGAPVEVAPETADIIGKALRYCEESGGLFDITIGAVSSLWDFKEGIVPDQAALAKAVEHVDYRCVEVDGNTVVLSDPRAMLDLGGIAKGYIADDLCALLAADGCLSGFVNLGGNVKTIGVRPDGSPWRVGIQDPEAGSGGAVVALVDSCDTSVVTSGLYERQFEKDGRRYWHILDPATGYPVETDLLSASIISAASLDGDGYTKPLFCLGRAAALEWMEAHEGIEGLVIGMDGTVAQTSGCGADIA